MHGELAFATSDHGDDNEAMGRSAPALYLFAGLAAGAIYATSAFAATLGRDALRDVVAACAVAKTALNVSFPCTDVVLGKPDAEGYALIRSPGYASEFLISPLSAIDGIESPELRTSAATGLWNAAWTARSDVAAALGRPLARTALGLAVNAVASRTQDHFHIHIDCVQQDVSSTLVAGARGIGEGWAPFPRKLAGRHYWVRAITAKDLSGVNVPQLIAAAPPAAKAPAGAATLAVVGARLADGSDGFYLLANWQNTSAERLLDHDCVGR
jgi:CDP-diacylglycerol pyrophosphatase